MSDIQWDREAHLIRRTGAGEEVEAQGVVQQLVGAFLEMPADQQNGLTLRVGGEDLQEYDASAIRELAAHPGFTGVYGDYDSELDEDEPDHGEAPSGIEIDAGVTGSSRA